MFYSTLEGGKLFLTARCLLQTTDRNYPDKRPRVKIDPGPVSF